MASLFTADQLPTTSLAALREFDDRYLAGSGAAPPPSWATDLGDMTDVDAPMVTFPLSALGVKYQATQGENRSKTAQEKSFDVKVEEFDEGIEAKLLDLFKQVYAYRKWTEGPARLLNAEARHRNRAIATLLEANPTWSPDGQAFFATTHPCNLGDSGSATWSNYQGTPADVTDLAKIEAEVTAMMGVLDEQGEKMDVRPDTILVPTAKFEALKNKLAQNLILDGTGVAAVNNPYLGRFSVVHVPELTDVNDWYLLDSKLIRGASLPPWIAMRYRVPASLAQRMYDETSDFFKDTGRIKYSSHIWYGFALAMPHAIRLVKGA